LTELRSDTAIFALIVQLTHLGNMMLWWMGGMSRQNMGTGMFSHSSRALKVVVKLWHKIKWTSI